MRILFCSESFPGRFGPLASCYASFSCNQILFASYFDRKNFIIPSIQRVILRRSSKHTQNSESSMPRECRELLTRSCAAAESLRILKDTGFLPDLVLASGSGMPMFSIRELFPQAFLVYYIDSVLFDAEQPSAKMQAMRLVEAGNAAFCDALFLCGASAGRTFPPVLRKQAEILPAFVDTVFFAPSGERHPECISIDADALDERDENILRHLLESVLDARPQCMAVLTFRSADAAECGCRRFSTLPPTIFRRILFHAVRNISDFRNVLQNSTVHICLSNARNAENAILQALSCGVPVMQGDNAPPRRMYPGVLHFQSGEDGASLLSAWLAQPEKLRSQGSSGRLHVERWCSADSVLPSHMAKLQRMLKSHLSGMLFP
ncbi:MAG: hypothetical protein PUB69_03570 [Desulfovibrionaceae bacterium]|nr:hypothetical protein [Desulfovibrionaceae bacterium]